MFTPSPQKLCERTRLPFMEYGISVVCCRRGALMWTMPAMKRFRVACLLFKAACTGGRRAMSRRLRGLVLGSLPLLYRAPRGWGCYIYSTRPCLREGSPGRRVMTGPHLWAPSGCYLMAFKAGVVHKRVSLSGTWGRRAFAHPQCSGSRGTWVELWGAEGAPMSAQAALSVLEDRGVW
ncbi:hypothetical protein NDU88_003462 [Pleurodeles waltl]|uniref:Uncharacterized protein n=1 Tax=Pleurodeles waltl TaxID=8319 RepID=A0AAV7T5F1_PLEWA|nr:hypothetical protein NDU88_003462 [Pleurodeles waltl]